MFKITKKGEAQLRDAYLQAVYEMGEYTYAEAAKNLTEVKYGHGIITDTGELLSSEEFKKTKTGAKLVFKADHASDIEYGTPAGTVADLNDLKAWAKRKLGLKEKEAIGAAYGIKQNIFNNGTEPRPFIRHAVYKTINYYKNKKVRA